MAGHSQFKNIMVRKGKQDAKRGKVFTKIAREIISAVKTGMPDAASNPRLRSAIAWAREENMPRDKIDAAIRIAWMCICLVNKFARWSDHHLLSGDGKVLPRSKPQCTTQVHEDLSTKAT